MVEKVIIIGSGPAGLAAAIYTAREGYEPLILGGYEAGGQLILTTLVENIPGFPEGVQGPEFIQLMTKQAEKFGTRILNKDVTSVDLKSKPFKLVADKQTYEANSIIIATGANAKTLGLESEQAFMGRGVSTCATCDGAFFKGKNLIVVGGGDTAMEDSVFLTRFASSVTIVHRRDSFRASKIMQDKALSNPKIKVIWNSTITEIKGDSKVKSVVLKNLVNNQVSEMPIDGVFLAIGYEPNTKLFSGQIDLDKEGYVIGSEEVKTNIEGVFVAGDVADKVYRQAATAAASGVKAALQVRAYLQQMPEK